MVQVETSQLIAECNNWRDVLRGYREELTSDKEKLQKAASASLSKDQLQEVDHLHNQIHIQLINIHDLRHSIKAHARKIDYEMNVNSSKLRHETVAEHEDLFEQYQRLDSRLQDLKMEFGRFFDQL